MRPEQYRVLRDAAGMTQAEVAARTGANPRTVRRWESTHEPPADVIACAEGQWGRVRAAVEAIIDVIPDDVEAVVLSRHTSRTWVDQPGWTLDMHAAVTRLVWSVLTLDDVGVSVVPVVEGQPPAIYLPDGPVIPTP